MLDFCCCCNIIYGFIVFIGFYALTEFLHDNLKSLVSIIISDLVSYFNPTEDLTLVERYGNWAVITGATDGIGKQFALNLAEKGLNIVLISRNEQRLKDVSKEIETKYSVETKYIVADFAQGIEIYPKIAKELEGIDIGILVNNVGKMHDAPTEFFNIPEQNIWDVCTINVNATTMMTRMLVNQMKEKKRGLIVNMSSAGELQPLPYKNVYCATKVYIRNFTLALAYELKPYDVTVQLVTPSFIRTKMNAYSETVMAGNFLIPDVESFGKQVIYTLGKTSKTTGYWSHAIQYTIMKMAPEWLRFLIAARMHKNLKEEYIRTQNKKKINKTE